MLEEDKLPSGLQDSSNTANSLGNAGNRTQRKRANDCIDCAVGQWNAFSRKVEKFDVDLRLTSLGFCQTNHSWIGFERVNLVYSCGIVMGEVHARTYTDFENCPFSRGDNPLAHIADGLWIAQPFHDMRIDVVSVEIHYFHTFTLSDPDKSNPLESTIQ